MSNKKTYLKGYKYWLFQSLVTPSTLVLENDKSYSNGHLEAKIYVSNGLISMIITDGFKDLYYKSGFTSIKQAMNIAHGKMELEFNTHKNPDLLVNRALNYNK